MKIALAQINTTIGDFQGNSKLILEYIRRAGQRNADLVVFPELTLTGYPPKDLLDRPDFIQANLKALQALRKKIKNVACVVGFVDQRKDLTGKPLANAAALIHRGKVLHVVHKTLLPTYDVFDEGRYFEAGRGHAPVVSFKGKKLGISICEDMWSDESYWGRRFYTQNPIQEQMEAGADILINISASPYSMGKGKVRRDVLTNPAKKYGVPVVYVNLVGGNDDLIFDGTSSVIDAKGREVLRLAS
ncbi:MAG: nitrilase-related carbon-nitrogen hydrolase, partial [bacterium]|nr:nitrilase-related carbon-nitrogen hydrolase [bacterium]